jgi:hypothetical protein
MKAYYRLKQGMKKIRSLRTEIFTVVIAPSEIHAVKQSKPDELVNCQKHLGSKHSLKSFPSYLRSFKGIFD